MIAKQDFQIDKNEFYDGKWFNEKEALNKTKDVNQRKVIQNILNFLSIPDLSTPEVE